MCPDRSRLTTMAGRLRSAQISAEGKGISMDVTAHAIQRFRERVEVCTDHQAVELILDIVERGHEPSQRDWSLFRITPEACKSYFVAYRVMAVCDMEHERVLTVLVPKRRKFAKIPNIRELRGVTVRDALRALLVEE